MEFLYYFALAGLLVGFVVGLTGVGGGSLMTPILIHFGVSPAVSVVTDLLYAAITKGGGIYVHHKKHNVDWRIAGLLCCGSIPAALATLWFLSASGFDSETVNTLIKVGLGWAILITAFVILFKQQIMRYSRQNDIWITRLTGSHQNAATVIVGFVMGVIVTLTSIGAGALGTVALFLLFPFLPVVRLVGTEIAHAVPLTLVAGLGHASVGNVDWNLLLNLLIGSLPGVFIGSHLAHRVSDKYLRPGLAIMLIYAGSKLAF